MRDNSRGMPELLDAYERDGNCFAVVQIIVSRESVAFEFGIEPKNVSRN